MILLKISKRDKKDSERLIAKRVLPFVFEKEIITSIFKDKYH
jgi:hypothetical protein